MLKNQRKKVRGRRMLSLGIGCAVALCSTFAVAGIAFAATPAQVAALSDGGVASSTSISAATPAALTDPLSSFDADGLASGGQPVETRWYYSEATAETSAKTLDDLIELQSIDSSGNVALKPGNYANWIDRIDVPDYATSLYAALVEAADADGTDDFLITGTYNGATRYPVASVSGTATSEDDMNAQLNALKVEMQKYTYAVAAAFDRDHPEVFWVTGGVYFSFGYSYATDFSSFTCRAYYVISSTSSSIIQSGYDESTIKADIATRDAAADAILAKATGTNAEKVKAFNTILTTQNEYNTDLSSGGAAPDSAYGCLCALVGSSGATGPVCEGYARAFKVLCDRANIPCTLVDGYAVNSSGSSGAHMWNYVQIGSKWYGVDVTWDDPIVSGISGKVSGYENEQYLLVGSETTNSSGRTFLQSHPVSNAVYTVAPNFTNGPILNADAYDGSEDPALSLTASCAPADKGEKATVTTTLTGADSATYRFYYSADGTTWTQAARNATGTTTVTATPTNAARQWKVVATTADGQTAEASFAVTINDPVVTTSTTPAAKYNAKATVNVSAAHFGTYCPAKYKYYYSADGGKTWKQVAYHNKQYTATDSVQVTANGTNAKRLWKVIVTFKDGRTAEAPFTVSYGA